MTHRLAWCLVLAMAFMGCGDKKKADDSNKEKPEEGATADAASATPEGGTPATQKGSATGGAVPSDKRSRTSTNQKGEKRLWTERGGITVKGEQVKNMLYKTNNGNSDYVGFKAEIEVGDQDCLIDWEADLMDGDKGEGKRVFKLAGFQAVKAGSTVVLSDGKPWKSDQAQTIKSAKTTYWTRCGDEMVKYPHEHQVVIEKVGTEQIKLGTVFDIHHTVIDFATTFDPGRCHFDVVAEDVDAEGYTLNSAFNNYSLGKGIKGQIKVPRSTSNEKDYVELVKDKRVHVKSMECVDSPFDPAAAKLEGIEISDVELVPVEGEPKSGGQLVSKLWNYKAKLKNTLGRDCAFSVKFALIDKQGFPMHRVPIMTTFHLTQDSEAEFTEGKGVWMTHDQADIVDKMVVTEAGPQSDCKYFKADKAL